VALVHDLRPEPPVVALEDHADVAVAAVLHRVADQLAQQQLGIGEPLLWEAVVELRERRTGEARRGRLEGKLGCQASRHSGSAREIPGSPG
jgi:hypothetical protein